MNTMQRLAVIGGMTLALVGCDNSSSSTPPAKAPGTATIDQLKKDATSAADKAAEYTKEKAEEVSKSFQSAYDSLSSQVSELKDKAANASDETKEKAKAALDDLDAKKDALKTKLDELGSKTGTAFAEAQKGVSKAMDELKAAYDKAKDAVK